MFFKKTADKSIKKEMIRILIDMYLHPCYDAELIFLWNKFLYYKRKSTGWEELHKNDKPVG